MNKTVIYGKVGFPFNNTKEKSITRFEGKDYKKIRFNLYQWNSRFNSYEKKYLTCESWSDTQIEKIQDGFIIELIDYEIKPNSYKNRSGAWVNETIVNIKDLIVTEEVKGVKSMDFDFSLDLDDLNIPELEEKIPPIINKEDTTEHIEIDFEEDEVKEDEEDVSFTLDWLED